MANTTNRFEEFRVSPQETPKPNRFQQFKTVPTKPQDPVEAFDALPLWQQGLQAADDTVRLMANGMTFGQMDKIAGYLSGDGTEAERTRTADAKARAGSAAIPAELIGGGMTGYLLPAVGSGYLGSMGTGALYGAVDGGLRDAETWTDRAKNAALGGAAGGLLGGVAHGAVDAVSAATGAAGRMWRNWGLAPEDKAAAKIADIADTKFGPYNAMSMDRSIAKLGPEAARVDVLGETGRAVGRKAANVSPEAREGIESFAYGRKSGQNDRLAADVQVAGGMSPGSMVPVEKLKADAYDAVRPQIHAAYDTARKAGADVPLELFDNVITTPLGAPVFRQALDNMTSRAARDPAAGGNLAVIDETKRLLEGKAEQALRAGDPMASEYAAAAKALRERMDAFLGSGEEYATARAMRAKAYRAEEAFDAGEALGRRSVPFDALAAGRQVSAEYAPNMSKAYAQTKAQRLANLPSTDGALNEFSTAAGKEAAKVALGDRGAETLAEAVSREKTFNLLPKSLGNSTTARQEAELANPALDALAGGLAAGGSFLPAGAIAIGGRLARAGALAGIRNAVTRGQREAAPSIVENLIGRGLLKPGKHLDRSYLEKLAAGMDPLTAARVLLGAGLGGMEAQRDGLAGAFQ